MMEKDDEKPGDTLLEELKCVIGKVSYEDPESGWTDTTAEIVATSTKTTELRLYVKRATADGRSVQRLLRSAVLGASTHVSAADEIVHVVVTHTSSGHHASLYLCASSKEDAENLCEKLRGACAGTLLKPHGEDEGDSFPSGRVPLSWQFSQFLRISVSMSSAERRDAAQNGELCHSGIRSICWRQYLGGISSELPVSRWMERVRYGRETYWKERERLLPGNVMDLLQASPTGHFRRDASATAEAATLKSLVWEIYKDVRRTHCTSVYFRERKTQELMIRVLLVYALVNETIRYRQGMNELLAVILQLLEREKVDTKLAIRSLTDMLRRDDCVDDDVKAGDSQQRQDALRAMAHLLDATQVEADAYVIFSLITSRMTNVFQPKDIRRKERVGARDKGRRISASGNRTQLLRRSASEMRGDQYRKNYVIRRLRYVHDDLLRASDVHLSKHLRTLGLEPQFYLLRWMRLLFAREFPISQLCFVWDAVFATTPDDFDLCDYVAVAILSTYRKLLLETENLADLVSLLQRSEMSSSKGDRVCLTPEADAVVKKALELQRSSVFFQERSDETDTTRSAFTEVETPSATKTVDVADLTTRAKMSSEWPEWLRRKESREDTSEEDDEGEETEGTTPKTHAKDFIVVVPTRDEPKSDDEDPEILVSADAFNPYL